ncbi:serine threonine kinase [Trichoderma arundinaceum]|uniref:Serine threonine kinase n=1 Tax=Trichoderma arundinaceum TaxID=490622 RepID=A0A395NQD5_TRIAR|nr:serine threonine kinase [Trichoderma arundinaceum]
MPPPSQDSTQPNTCTNSSSQPASSSVTQLEPRAAAAAAVLAAGESTRPFSQPRSLPDSSSKTQIEPRVAAIAATLAVRSEHEAETTDLEAPTIENITALLNKGLPAVPEARLIIASSQYPNDTGEDLSIVRLPHTVKNRVTFGVIQTTQDVDFLIKPSFKSHSTLIEVECQIVFDPGSDDCLLINRTSPKLCLACLSSALPTKAHVEKSSGHVIRPGIWRISLDGDGGEIGERHLVEFLLLRRKFSVSIRKAKMPLPAKRGADDDAQEKTNKRQRLKNDVTDIAVAHSTNKLATELDPATADTKTADSHHLASFSSAREIVNKAAVPILELTDKETAIIQTHGDSSTDIISQPTLTVKSPDAYQLQRIKHIGATHSTSVFACRHSATLEPLVAKVLRYNEESANNLIRFAELWKREKKILQNLKHRSIVALKAFDGRAVLIDFGMATFAEDTKTGGSPWYLPPELIENQTRGLPGDIWALGITMLYVLGSIDFPERVTKGWMISDLSKQGVSRQRMTEWLQFINRHRAGLKQVDEGDRREKIEYIVFNMLESETALH